MIINDFYYQDSADELKNNLIKKTNINNFIVKEINSNKYRLSVGPFINFNALKSTYISLNNLGFDDLNTANQISFILLLIILVLFFIENYSRGGAKYHQPSQGFKKIPKIEISGKKSIFAIVFLSLLFFFTNQSISSS